MDKRTVMAGLVAALAIACGDVVRDFAGRMAVDAGQIVPGDAGQMLVDAGAALMGGGDLDAGASSHGGAAIAQTPAGAAVLEGECNLEGGYKQQDEATSETALEAVSYYAEIDVSGYSRMDVARSHALLCNRSGTYTDAERCARDGVECAGNWPGFALEPNCVSAEGALFGDKLRIQCGERVVRNGSTDVDYRWNDIHLYIGQP